MALLIGAVYAWRTAPLLPSGGEVAAPEWSLSDLAGRRWTGADAQSGLGLLEFAAEIVWHRCEVEVRTLEFALQSAQWVPVSKSLPCASCCKLMLARLKVG